MSSAMSIILSLVISSTLSGERTLIDSFSNSDQWIAQAGSPKAEMYGPNLLLRLNFSEETERCYWDKEVDLNLVKYGRFYLRLRVKNPEIISNMTLYFKSGNGWYGCWFPLKGDAWQTIRLDKGRFNSEGTPAGWDKIDGIRLSFWKQKPGQTEVRMYALGGITDRIVVVRGNLTARKGSPETRSVYQFHRSMSDLLRDTGIEFGVINDTDVENGALDGTEVAIFPYNPDISQTEAEKIVEFVERGGKIMVFYSIPEPIARVLGIRQLDWTRQAYSGQFAEIVLCGDVPGTPDSIHQGSWNVRFPLEMDPGVQVIGRWMDSEGKDTGIPAVTLNQSGAFVGHVLLQGDTGNKRRFLLAMIAEMLPRLKDALGRAFLSGATRIGGFSNIEELSRFIESNLENVRGERAELSRRKLSDGRNLITRSGDALDLSDFPQALDLAIEARDNLLESYYLSFPSRPDEFRAVWCHSAFGIEGWSWEKAIEALAKNGIRAILPNMLWGGIAYYKSDVLPVAPEVAERGDQIDLCLEAARKHNIEVHVWKVNWNLSRASEEFIAKLRREKRLQYDRNGNEVKWLCPSHPDNFKLELESMLELVRKYDIDGIHFDYIRYPDGDKCFCDGCRERFERDTGLTVKNWPQDVIDGENASAFADWRRDRITRLVAAVSRQAKEIRPDIKVSAAVFSDYPRCRETVGQDWKLWIDNGYLDFVCPMDYTDNNDRFENLVKNQVSIVDGRIPLYPGIGASAPGLDADQVAMQIHIARRIGVPGFIIFNYDPNLAERILPALRKGITSE